MTSCCCYSGSTNRIIFWRFSFEEKRYVWIKNFNDFLLVRFDVYQNTIYIYTMYLIYSIHTAMLCLSVGLTLAYSSVSADCACLSDSQTGCSFACLSVGAFCFVFTHFVMAFSVLFSRGFCFVVFNILFGFMGIFMGGRVVNSKWIQHEHTRQYYIMICAGH